MRILNKKAVAMATTLSIPTIYRKVKNGTFPKQIHLSKGRVGWREDEIKAWVKSLSHTHPGGVS